MSQAPDQADRERGLKALRAAREKIDADIAERRRQERLVPIQGCAKLTGSDVEIRANERIRMAVALSEADPLVRTEIASLRKRVASLEERVGKAARAFQRLQRTLNALIAKQEAVTSGRAVRSRATR